IFLNDSGAQRVRFDDFRLDKALFLDTPCDPDSLPVARFERNAIRVLPESDTVQKSYTIHRVGFINTDSEARVLLSGGSAQGGLDYQAALSAPIAFAFTAERNAVTLPLFSIVDDKLNETTETIRFVINAISNIQTDEQSILAVEIVDDDDEELLPLPLSDSNYVVLEDNLFTSLTSVLANDQNVGPGYQIQLVDSTRNGRISLNPDGTFSYQPKPNFFGRDSFRYLVADSLNTSPLASVLIDVLPVNDAPRLNGLPAEQNIEQNTELQSLFFQANPGPREASQRLEITLGQDADKLSDLEVFPASGKNGYILRYRPQTNAVGETFLFLNIKDNGGIDNGGVDTLRWTIRIFIKPDAPVAVNDSYTVNEGQTLTVSDLSLGILANDRGFGTLAVLDPLVKQTDHGRIAVNSNGTFSYFPLPDYFGEDFFSYQVRNDFDTSNVATVVINVLAVNDPPEQQGLPLFISLEENQAEWVDTFQVSVGPDNERANQIIQSITISPNALLETASIDFTPGDSLAYLRLKPALDSFGTVSLQVLILDNGGVNNGGVDSLVTTLEVEVIRITPIVEEDRLEVWEDSILVFDPIDSLVANDDLLGRQPQRLIIEIGRPGQGDLTRQPEGIYAYRPRPNFSGTDSFDYRLVIPNDGDTIRSAFATVFIRVLEVNDAPEIEMTEADTSKNRIINLYRNESLRAIPFDIRTGPAEEDDQTILELSVKSQFPTELLEVLEIDEPTEESPNRVMLRLKPAPNRLGEIAAVIRVKDNGGIQRQGVDTTLYLLTIRINNTPPMDTIDLEANYSGDQPGIRVNWDNGLSNYTGFILERSVDGLNGGYTFLDSLASDVSLYFDEDVAFPTNPEVRFEYCYRLKAYNSVGESPYSDTACVVIYPNAILLPNAFTPNGDGNNDRLF
ncbi:MAG: tandem-95 repeat protein, partial [Bacteroidia bacterium]|nr:tandem-95 repeat protein [Bacteroidia bacterium]